MSLRKLYYLLPPATRLLVRKLVFLPQDLIQGLSKGDQLIPPKGDIYTGGGDFLEAGNRFLKLFIKYGGLAQDDRVLDIGSGIGRMAIPMTQFLTTTASYQGFDVIKKGVDWCTKNISSKFPNFKFHYVTLSNDLYRSDGQSAAKFVFPLKDKSQDFIFLTSVFTHLIQEDMEQYVKEIARLLDSGKKCFATYFVLDPDLEVKNKKFNFPFRHESYALMDQRVKSANIAFDKAYLEKLFKENGLEIKHYLPGKWRNPQMEALDFQDLIVLEKP